MAYVLTINGGSSSVKFALFETGSMLQRKSAGSVQRLSVVDVKAYGQAAADGLLKWLKPLAQLKDIAAIGHRIVHGGPKYLEHVLIRPEVLHELQTISPIDPDHLPGEIALIEAMGKYFPDVPQVACFDTVFHRDMPPVAKRLPIPRKYETEGVRRYGFHGLSYAYLMEQLGTLAKAQVAGGRVILAHLGNGCSMAAVRGGKSIDTTMAFTPTAGLMMGTRCGDLDPGVLVYLMREKKMSADQVDELVNKKSGLLGVSEISSDMRDLLAKQNTNPNAAEAVELFCYVARKWIGALAAALNGLDTLVFSGGIGENAPDVRSRICTGLEHLGVQIDAVRNNERAPIVSTDDAAVTVRVIPTDEEIMIARIVERIVGTASA
jgi:acetate kinase